MFKPSLIALLTCAAVSSFSSSALAAPTSGRATIKGVDYYYELRVTHYEMFATPRLAETALPFLNGQSAARSWADQVKAQTASAPKQ